MRAVDMPVNVLERDGVIMRFGVPGGAISPLLAAIPPRNTIRYVLALQGARMLGIALPNTASTQQFFNAAASGGRTWDHSGLVRALGIMARGHEARRSGDTGELLV